MEIGLGSIRLQRPTDIPVRRSRPRAPGEAPHVRLVGHQQPAPDKSRQDEAIASYRARLIERVARRELTVEEACREGAISRARFYQLRALYQAKGVEGLRPAPRARPDLRLPPRVESAILSLALLNPDRGERSIARVLARPELGGIKVSRHGVGEVLRRNGLSRREARLALAAAVAREQQPSETDVTTRTEVNWFASVYEKYRGYVYGVCLRQLGDPALAEDATQETFVRVYTNISRFDSRRSILPWLKTVAVNLCIDTYRRNGRVSVTDPEDEIWSGHATADETHDTVVAQERRAKLERALKQLPARQRRALLLYALEGWDYSEIASAEDTSIQAVKSLLFRARTSLRKSRESGLLGVVLLPFRIRRGRLRDVAHRTAERVETALPACTAGIQAIEKGALAIIMALGLGFGGTPMFAIPENAGSRALSATHIKSYADPASSGNRVASTQSDSDWGGSPTDAILNPTQHATPEDTQFQSIVPSPNFRHDRTVFAAGAARCARPPCYVLFVSRDAGASWRKLPAAGLAGSDLMLAPAFPSDGRIFVMGTSGLQVSSDGGNSFSLATLLTGGAAIAPNFADAAAGRRILIGGTGTIMEYWPDKDGLTKPAPLLVGPRQFSNVAFSPDYPRHEVIFAGSRTINAESVYGSAIDRCNGSLCTTISLPTLGEPRFTLSPYFGVDGLVVAYTAMSLFRSDNAGLHFDAVGLPPAFDSEDSLSSVVLVPDPSPQMFVAYATYDQGDTGLYRSKDGGKTWDALRPRLDGFRRGVQVIVSASNGRLLAAGFAGGLACSDDDGKTWHSRCTPS